MGNYLVMIKGRRFAIWKDRLQSIIYGADVNPFVWFVKDMQLGYCEGNNFDTYREAYQFCKNQVNREGI